MSGVSNQVQTPFGSGVRTALGLAAGAAGGVSQIPANPSVSVGGTLYGSLFTVWQSASTAANGYVTPLVLATYDNAAANGAGATLPTVTSINMGSIQQLNNAFSGTLASITSLVASSLIQISSDFSLNCANCTTLTMTSLKYIGCNFTANFALITSANFPALIAVNSACSPTFAAATSLTLTALTYVGVNFIPTCASATSVDISSLSYLGGSFQPSFATLATLNLPAITVIGGSVSITAANLVTFSLGTGLLSVAGNFTLTGAKLNQASVDNILVRLAALDGTGGTTAYSSKTINVSGGTSSAPSATGLTAKATLQGRGCTVTTN